METKAKNTRRICYSARVLCGRDHAVTTSQESIFNAVDFITKKPFNNNITKPETLHIDDSDQSTKVTNYLKILQSAEGRYFDLVVGRLYRFLKTEGGPMEEDNPDVLDTIFEFLRDIILDVNKSKAARWRLMELLELRSGGWQMSEEALDCYNESQVQTEEDSANESLTTELKASTKNKANPRQNRRPASPTDFEHFYNSRTGSSTSSISSSETSEFSIPADEQLEPLRRPYEPPLRPNQQPRSRHSSGQLSSHGSNGCLGLEQERASEEVFVSDLDKSTDSFSDISEDVSYERQPSSPFSVSAEQFRLLQINDGKPIHYTMKFLVSRWGSPHTRIIPSNLKHTIANSDIAYIITGPPFENPQLLLDLPYSHSVFKTYSRSYSADYSTPEASPNDGREPRRTPPASSTDRGARFFQHKTQSSTPSKDFRRRSCQESSTPQPDTSTIQRSLSCTEGRVTFQEPLPTKPDFMKSVPSNSPSRDSSTSVTSLSSPPDEPQRKGLGRSLSSPGGCLIHRQESSSRSSPPPPNYHLQFPPTSSPASLPPTPDEPQRMLGGRTVTYTKGGTLSFKHSPSLSSSVQTEDRLRSSPCLDEDMNMNHNDNVLPHQYQGHVGRVYNRSQTYPLGQTEGYQYTVGANQAVYLDKEALGKLFKSALQRHES